MKKLSKITFCCLLLVGVLSNLSAGEAYNDSKGTYYNGLARSSNIKGGRKGDYPCYSSRKVSMYVLYPYEKNKSLEWETPDFSAGKEKTYIDIPMGFGTGWIRPNMVADYNLYIDGKKYVTFNCTKKKKMIWKGRDGVRLIYYALFKDGVGEPHGRMLLELPPGFKHTESYLSLKVTPSKASAGNAWFMLHYGALYAGNDIAEWIKKRNFK